MIQLHIAPQSGASFPNFHLQPKTGHLRKMSSVENSGKQVFLTLRETSWISLSK